MSLVLGVLMMATPGGTANACERSSAREVSMAGILVNLINGDTMVWEIGR